MKAEIGSRQTTDAAHPQGNRGSRAYRTRGIHSDPPPVQQDFRGCARTTSDHVAPTPRTTTDLQGERMSLFRMDRPRGVLGDSRPYRNGEKPSFQRCSCVFLLLGGQQRSLERGLPQSTEGSHLLGAPLTVASEKCRGLSAAPVCCPHRACGSGGQPIHRSSEQLRDSCPVRVRIACTQSRDMPMRGWMGPATCPATLARSCEQNTCRPLIGAITLSTCKMAPGVPRFLSENVNFQYSVIYSRDSPSHAHYAACPTQSKRGLQSPF
jgi:hypothetical protein